MRLLVVDASVLIDALTSSSDTGDRARAAVRGVRLVAPEHLTVETFQGIRGLYLGGVIDADRAKRAVARLDHLDLQVVPTRLLLARMWELRDNLTGYDAAYVAAAEKLAVPLVTSDQKLAAATGSRCQIVVP